MNESWVILIYQTTDAQAQNLLSARLKATDGLQVETAESNGECFLIIECPGRVVASAVDELVTAIDVGAELVDTHAGQPNLLSLAVGARRIG